MNHKKIFLIIGLSLLILTIIILSGCLQSEPQPKELQEVTVKLKFFHQAQFAGFYTAQEKGFYTAKGLKVNLEEYSAESPALKAVGDGEAEFGVAGAIDLLQARTKGDPFKAIAVIYQTNPIVAYTLKNGINKPYDFLGKIVGLEESPDIKLLYSVMMNNIGIDRSKIKEVSIGWDAAELLAGKVDISTGYSINEPYGVISSGREVIIFPMSDYGADIYGDTLFTSDEMIKNNPKLVEDFLEATLQGWQYALENPDEAVNFTLKYASGRTREKEIFMLENSLPLIYHGDEYLGEMSKEKWLHLQNLLQKNALLEKEINVDEIYTNQFIWNIAEKNIGLEVNT